MYQTDMYPGRASLVLLQARVSQSLPTAIHLPSNAASRLQAKGSEPLKQYKWKAHGVKTVFEKQVKGNVFEVENDRCQLQLPADDKVNMHVTMGTLVIQVQQPRQL
jgi:hypothetical protein